jgi:hypothetical protein
MNTYNISDSWQQSSTEIFWGEIAPTDHVLQVYENDQDFTEALSGFVGGGINAGDCVIVIATDQHLQHLEKRLKNHGVYTKGLIAEDRFIPLNASEVLSTFMVNGWPDEGLFRKTVSALLQRAYKNKRRVRAFGEMVAILWAEGNSGATVQLEHLWNKFCAEEKFCLFCAYPKSGFTQDMNDSLNHICCSHSKMVTPSDRSLTEIYYRSIAPAV